MNITYATGTTDAQRQLIVDALAHCTFPFDLLTNVSVAVTFTPPPTDPALHGGKLEAYTTVTSEASATMLVHPGIITPGDPMYQGYDFAQETIIHELGHVCTLPLPESNRRQLAAALGFDFDTAWSYQEVGGNWSHAGQESVAETFKDLWMAPVDRRFDNRTVYRLRDLPTFVHAVDQIGAVGGTPGTPAGVSEVTADWGPFIAEDPITFKDVLAVGWDLVSRNTSIQALAADADALLALPAAVLANMRLAYGWPTEGGPVLFIQLRADYNEAWPSALADLNDPAEVVVELQWDTVNDNPDNPDLNSYALGGTHPGELYVGDLAHLFAGPWSALIGRQIGDLTTLTADMLNGDVPYKIVAGWRPIAGMAPYIASPTVPAGVTRLEFSTAGTAGTVGPPLDLALPAWPYASGRVAVGAGGRAIIPKAKMRVIGHQAPGVLIKAPPPPAPPAPPTGPPMPT